MAGGRAQAVAAQGFTLIELVITVAIAALLASVALPGSELAVQRTKEQELRRTLRQIRDAIDMYKQASDERRIRKSIGDSGYPKKLEDLAEGVDDQKSPKKQKIYFLRRIPRDPLNADPTLSAAATWGKRSYTSPTDDPSECDDVLDVLSYVPGTYVVGRRYCYRY